MADQSNMKPAEPMPASTSTTSAPAKSGGNKTMLLVIIGIVILLCCCAVGGGVFFYLRSKAAEVITQDAVKNSVQQQLSGSTGTQQSLPAPDAGKTKTSDGMSFTLNGVKKDGNNVIFDLTVTNTSATVTSFSTLLDMTVKSEKTDAYGENYFYTIPDAQKLDKEVPAYGTISGQVAFTVDDNPHTLNLVMTGDAFSDNKVTFAIY